jgi:formate hydrogenlyase subunit 4
MVILGIGAGAAFTPLTASGVAGVAAEDAGAASGLVNVAHQLGGSLGLGVLVTVFAAAAPQTNGLAHAVAASLTVGAVMLAVALAVVVATILVRNGRPVVEEARVDALDEPAFERAA